MTVLLLNTARANARDAKRKADFQQLKTAMQLYYDDHGHYPGLLDDGTPDWSLCGTFWDDCTGFWRASTDTTHNDNWNDFFQAELAPYIKIPQDAQKGADFNTKIYFTSISLKLWTSSPERLYCNTYEVLQNYVPY